MRIYGVNNQINVYNATKSTGQTTKSAKKQDALSVSSVARECQTAYQALKEVPDIREEKVADIKARIKSGTYNVSAEEVSEKIMSQIDLRG